jgi:hypothetical protein
MADSEMPHIPATMLLRTIRYPLLLSSSKAVRHLTNLANSRLSAIHVRHVRGRRALSEPLDQRLYRCGLADCEYFDAPVGKITRVAATTELLRPLAS